MLVLGALPRVADASLVSITSCCSGGGGGADTAALLVRPNKQLDFAEFSAHEDDIGDLWDLIVSGAIEEGSGLPDVDDFDPAPSEAGGLFVPIAGVASAKGKGRGKNADGRWARKIINRGLRQRVRRGTKNSRGVGSLFVFVGCASCGAGSGAAGGLSRRWVADSLRNQATVPVVDDDSWELSFARPLVAEAFVGLKVLCLVYFPLESELASAKGEHPRRLPFSCGGGCSFETFLRPEFDAHAS